MPLRTTLDERGTSKLFMEDRETFNLLMEVNELLDTRADYLRKLLEGESNQVVKQEYLKNLKLLTNLQEKAIESASAVITSTLSSQPRLVPVPR